MLHYTLSVHICGARINSGSKVIRKNVYLQVVYETSVSTTKFPGMILLTVLLQNQDHQRNIMEQKTFYHDLLSRFCCYQSLNEFVNLVLVLI